MECWYNHDTNIVEVTDYSLIGFESLHEMEHMHDTALVAKNLRQDMWWMQVKTKYYHFTKGEL